MRHTTLLCAALAVALVVPAAAQPSDRELRAEQQGFGFTITSLGEADRLQWTFSVITGTLSLQRLADGDLEQAQWRLQQVIEYQDDGDLSYGPGDKVLTTYDVAGSTASRVNQIRASPLTFEATIPLERQGPALDESTGTLTVRMTTSDTATTTTTGPLAPEQMAVDLTLTDMTATQPGSRYVLAAALETQGDLVSDLGQRQVTGGEASRVTLGATPSPMPGVAPLGLHQRAGEETTLVELAPDLAQGVRFGATGFDVEAVVDAVLGSPWTFALGATGALAVAGTPVWRRMRQT